ncbi:MAG: acetone carboxylase subunit gamma [Lautropia sp.]|nr:acetone carboxylase subunit gamma [Lautropia sp.]
MSYERSKIADLIDGTIDRDTLHQMQSTPKDPERFETYVSVLQERVGWDDRIILPLGPKLFVVQEKGSNRWVIKSEAGHVFCDWKDNWKLHAVVYVRDTQEKLDELYPKLMAPTEGWQVIREYYCPKSGDLLDVEAPTPWYPVIHDFEPDIEAFYKETLGLPVPECSNP